MSKGRGESWRNTEDVALCTAVVSIGEDGDKATGQAKTKLWERISVVYETIKPENVVERGGGACEARWRRIRPACTKWREALTKAEAAFSSGQNATDLELQAKSIYCLMNKGKDFAFAHCWPILEHSLKFSPPISMDDNPIFSSPISLGDGEERANPSSSSSHARPIGQKAQKLAKKYKSSEERTSLIADEMRRSNELYQLEYEQGKINADRTANIAEQARLQAERAEENEIMSKDPSQFPPQIKAYWERKQAAVIEKMQRQDAAREQEFSNWNFGI